MVVDCLCLVCVLYLIMVCQDDPVEGYVCVHVAGSIVFIVLFVIMLSLLFMGVGFICLWGHRLRSYNLNHILYALAHELVLGDENTTKGERYRLFRLQEAKHEVARWDDSRKQVMAVA